MPDLAPTAHEMIDDKTRLAMVRRCCGRSRIVGFWRLVLPISIFVIILSLAGWIVAHALLDGIEPPAAETGDPSLIATGLSFMGRDNNDRHYMLVAKQAVRDATDKGLYTLANPTFSLGAGRVRANEGVYNVKSTDIILRGDVVVISADGGRMETQEALIDTRTGEVTNTRAPQAGRVQIDNDMGSISADDYIIGKNGEVTFRGRVRGVINPN